MAENTPKTAIQRFITPNGIIISDSSSTENQNKEIKDFVANYNQYHSTLANGKTVSYYDDSKELNDEAYYYYVPLQIGENEEEWIVQTFISKSTMLETFNSVLKISITAAIIISVIIASIPYFSIKKNLRPLKDEEYSSKSCRWKFNRKHSRKIY